MPGHGALRSWEWLEVRGDSRSCRLVCGVSPGHLAVSVGGWAVLALSSQHHHTEDWGQGSLGLQGDLLWPPELPGGHPPLLS